jgi:hypothetical protein
MMPITSHVVAVVVVVSILQIEQNEVVATMIVPMKGRLQ